MENKIEHYEFSCFDQPKVDMEIKAKIERVQPYCAGVDKHGTIQWQGLDMPRWQCELLRFAPDWFGDFFTRWIEVAKYQARSIEFDPEMGYVNKNKAARKERINELKRMYPRRRGNCNAKKKTRRGDVMSGHTPTPWQRSGSLVVKDLSYDKTVTAALYEIANTRIGHWSDEQAEANAAFIVRAVNVHEELLEAAKDMLADMEAYYEVSLSDKDLEGDPLLRYRQAIAKAEDR